ncbi:M20/M25/M40 family metallo-hydrolase [Sporohalobacter salinus]|uniref:M20/M25/M40 family metallo-hydrolase n=1 Tax=Sporohalobacter salinus TaxID=1494606 RepID=UPI001961440A|nr:M20/M25/M40 family metallo-hydrolase [Sporohalobacter salinus]MBM7622797.1 arginine utilization protein RocB [Sporohalobacter salinus]
MTWLQAEKIKSLLIELVNEPSISGTKQETTMGKKIFNILNRIDYFKETPEHLFLEPLPNDKYDRHFVSAFLEGTEKSKKTVILLSHFDVVDISDYGEYKDLAFKPKELTEKLKGNLEFLSDEAAHDLETGNYLFGRGVADMKSGLAIQIALMEYLSQNQNKLDGNLVLITVPDEETTSQGINDSVPFLNELKNEYDLEYEAVINCEPVFPNYPGDDNKYIYTGSIGKSLPAFYFYGKETHVGASLNGLNCNLMAAEVLGRIEGNLDLSEEMGQVVSPPPTCLQYADNKELYSAKIPHDASSYFNMLLLSSSPEEILIKLKQIAKEAFEEVLNRIEDRRKEYSKKKNVEFKPVEWEANVYYYSEIYKMAYDKIGEKLDDKIQIIYEKYKDNNRIDQQGLGMKIIEQVHHYCPNKEPKIIIGYLPPYYPPVSITGVDSREKRILNIMDEVVTMADDEFNEDLEICESFPGISDLSYFRLDDFEATANYLKPNMPNWNLDYSIPIKEVNNLDVPGINISVYGKDVHKFTERLELDYSLNVVPELLKYSVLRLLRSVENEY